MKGLHPLALQVEQFLNKESVGNAGMVVAVSGGPDSVALLRALLSIRARTKSGHTGPLIVAHLNHQLRGEESDVDEAFVHGLCAALVTCGQAGLQFCCQKIDIATLAKTEGNNLESVARRIRYEWLTGIAIEKGVPFLATGHTADDQAETILHRILRGTGLQGLRGIAARRPLAQDVELLRPMLYVGRAQVLDFLQSAGQSFRQDQSNLDLGYTRNRIRLELLPALAQDYNPGIVPALCHLAEQADAAHQLETSAAQNLLAEAERPRAGHMLVFDRALLAAAPRHLVRALFRLAWAREGWPVGAMGFREWEKLAMLVTEELPVVDLPGGVRAGCVGRVVQVRRLP